MADPVKPELDYSYTGFQQETQDRPFPGNALDNDLAELKRAADDTIDALKSVRRADGKLQNRVVTRDSLAADLAVPGAGLNPDVYDPNGIEADAFDRANHYGSLSADVLTDGTTNKAYTAAERTALAGKLSLSGGAMTGRLVASTNSITGNNPIGVSTFALGEIEVRGNGTGAAMLAFNRPMAFATYFGIDTDNRLKIGGWSHGSNSYRVMHEGLDSGTFSGSFSWTGTQQFSGGLNFGNNVAATAGDLTKHIRLFGTTTGINATSSQMNFVAGAGATFYWYTGNVERFKVQSDGNVFAQNNMYAGNGTACFYTSGNIAGSIWSGYGTGHLDAYTAIQTRIENRIASLKAANFNPQTDNAHTLGASGFRWASVWAVNGTIQTSDERQKEIEAQIEGAKAAQVIDAIDPILFRWLVGSNEIRQVEDGFDEREEPVTELVEVASTEIVVEDGKAFERAVTRSIEVQAFRDVPIVDADGSPRMEVVEPAVEAVAARPAVKDPETGEIIEPAIKAVKAKAAVMRQATHRQPVKRTVKTPRYRQEVVPVAGTRRHAGFSAQQIKAALDASDLDCGAWGLADKTDPDSEQFLRPDQLIPILWAALKQTRAELAGLKQEIADQA